MTKKQLDTSTEEKIKTAARNVFLQKGYAGTRTRDIAEEAGINLALLNYYFRSKEKLFDLIMTETLHGFLRSLTSAFNNEETSLESKVEMLAAMYIDLLLQQPLIPLFIMSELRTHPQKLVQLLSTDNIIRHSVFRRQYDEAMSLGEITQQDILHFVMNILGLTVFPFIASPLLKGLDQRSDEEFTTLMLERKKMIPVWIKSMFWKH